MSNSKDKESVAMTTCNWVCWTESSLVHKKNAHTSQVRSINAHICSISSLSVVGFDSSVGHV